MCRPCSLAVCYFSLSPPLFPSLPPYVDFCQFSLSIHVGQFTGVPCFLSSWTSLPHIYHVFPSFSCWGFGVRLFRRLDEKGYGNSCKGLWPLPLSIKRGGLKSSLKLCIVGIRSCQTDTAGLSSFLPPFVLKSHLVYDSEPQPENQTFPFCLLQSTSSVSQVQIPKPYENNLMGWGWVTCPMWLRGCAGHVT